MKRQESDEWRGEPKPREFFSWKGRTFSMPQVSSPPAAPPSLRILVIGGGVIGSVYAAWLQKAGQQVTILERGQHLADLRDQGLRIEDTGTGQVLTTPIT